MIATRPLQILEVYPFGKGLGQSFAARGHAVHVVDFKLQRTGFAPAAQVIQPTDLASTFVRDRPWDLVLLRPFCVTYSPAARFMHYRDTVTGEPLKDKAREHDQIVRDMLTIARRSKPRLGFVLENPHADLRKCAFMAGIPVITLTLCQYGSEYRKATDLFGNVPASFFPRACKPGASCHYRGSWTSKTGQQWGGMANSNTTAKRLDRKFDRQTALQRAFLPLGLSTELCVAFEDLSTTVPYLEDR